MNTIDTTLPNASDNRGSESPSDAAWDDNRHGVAGIGGNLAGRFPTGQDAHCGFPRTHHAPP